MTTERCAVLLDLDGTLLTLPVEIEAVRARLVAEAAGLGIASQMRPILAEIDRVAALVPGQAARLRQRWRAAVDAAELSAAEGARPCPGAAIAAEYLMRSQTPFGIVTDNGRACIEPALRVAGLAALARGAQVMLSRDELEAPKPDPEGVQRAAAALLGSGGRLYVIGDSERDMVAAKCAGGDAIEVVAVGVIGGQSSRAVLEAAGADVIMESVEEVVEILEPE